MTRLDDVVPDIADLLAPSKPSAEPQTRWTCARKPLSPRRRARSALPRMDRSHGARPRSHAPRLGHRRAAAAWPVVASSSSQRPSGAWPNSTLRSRSPPLPGIARRGNQTRGGRRGVDRLELHLRRLHALCGRTVLAPNRQPAQRHASGRALRRTPEHGNIAYCSDFLRGPRRPSNPGPSALSISCFLAFRWSSGTQLAPRLDIFSGGAPWGPARCWSETMRREEDHRRPHCRRRGQLRLDLRPDRH